MTTWVFYRKYNVIFVEYMAIFVVKNIAILGPKNIPVIDVVSPAIPVWWVWYTFKIQCILGQITRWLIK